MIYNLKCNKCSNISSSAKNTDDLFIKAKNEGFKIIKDIKVINQPSYRSETTTTYEYICPVCHSKDVKIKIGDKDKEKEVKKIKYLINETGDVDTILNLSSETSEKLNDYEVVYNNDLVESGKKTINIYKKDNKYYLRVMRIVGDGELAIENYVEDEVFHLDEKTKPEFNMDNIYNLYSEEYSKNIKYNFYLVEFTSLADLIHFTEKSFNKKEIFDIKNKVWGDNYAKQ